MHLGDIKLLNKKLFFLVIFTGIIFYILYVFILYPYCKFEEIDAKEVNNNILELLNDPQSLSLYEISSHGINMKNSLIYKNAYNNPLRFKKYYLKFLEKNNLNEDQLYLILKLSCNLPPKNQSEFYKKVVLILFERNVDQNYFEIVGASISDCVTSGHSFLPKGSYFWIPYLTKNYQELAEMSPELKTSIDSFIRGRTFTRYLGYKLGEKDT